MQIQTLTHDLQFGFRMLRKHPGLALVCILTLAIGIGSSTAIFSIVQSVLLEPLGFPEAQKIVAVWESTPNGRQPRSRATPANFFDWRDRNRSFSHMAAFSASDLTLTGVGDPEQLRGAAVTPAYFDVLKVTPILGRAFLSDESQSGKGRIVILSEGLWHRRFASDPQILGKSVKLSGNDYAVVGVLPGGLFPVWPATGKFSFDQQQQQFYIPLTETEQQRMNRRSHVWGVIGRLADGTTVGQAQRDMDRIGSELALEYPQFNEGEGITLRPIAEELVGNVRSALWILFAAVGVVLLVACANVAGLLLARHASRHREVAIRTALGASRLRLVRQFLTEGVLLALLGGVTGVWFAVMGFDVLLTLIPQAIPRLGQISLDGRMLSFAVGVSLLSTVLFGLAPAIEAARASAASALQDGARSSTGAGRSRLRSVLVATQIALATTLLIASGLLIRSYIELQGIKPGFNPDRMLVAELSIPASRYPKMQQVTGFYSQLLERVQGLPGVESVAASYDHPLEANWIDNFSIEGKSNQTSNESPSAWLRIVSAGYFHSVGTTLQSGREFAATDDLQHPGVVVINDAFARRFFPGENPLGKRLRVTSPSSNWGADLPTSFEIVGVAAVERFLGLNADPPPAYYLSDKQFPQSSMSLMVRSRNSDPVSLVNSLRATVLSMDRDQPIASIQTMESLMTAQTVQQRFNTSLMTLFGLASLLLATIGIFGLVSYQVNQRMGEFGIRTALGAQPRDILRLVIGHGVALSLVGVGVGLVLSLALNRLLAVLLFGVGARDTVTFAAVALLLLMVAFLASWVPARRAIKMSPIDALRQQ